MATNDPRPGARGDEAELFRAFNDQLMKTVSGSVFNCTPQTVEDACAFAWAQFLEHQPDRTRNWRGWLFRTAERQAWLLERQARENMPLRSFEWEDLRATIQGISEDTLEIQQDVADALSIIGPMSSGLRASTRSPRAPGNLRRTRGTINSPRWPESGPSSSRRAGHERG
jgi:DNA-directed RNA polymerase specialized sigma24 family protein